MGDSLACPLLQTSVSSDGWQCHQVWTTKDMLKRILDAWQNTLKFSLKSQVIDVVHSGLVSIDRTQ